MHDYDRRQAKAIRPSYGRDHFLIADGPWLYIVRLQKSGDKPIACLVANIHLQPAKGCGNAMEVYEAAAESGYGPAIYDAALAYVYPKGLTAAMGSTSTEATRIWDFYFESRSDVAKEPKPDNAQCRLKGRESLDHIYFKSGRVPVMSLAAFNKHPRVIEHFGKPLDIAQPRRDLYDCTPAVSWG